MINLFYHRIYCGKFSFMPTASGAVKRDFRTYIHYPTIYIPNEHFEY